MWRHLTLAGFAVLGLVGSSLAVDAATPASAPVAAAPLPALPPPPAPPALVGNGAPGVDHILDRIQRNLAAGGDVADEQAAETSLGRNLNIYKSGLSAIKPVGYLEVNGAKMAFARGEDGSVLTLRAGTRLGPVVVKAISEAGVSYTLAGKNYVAPLAFVPVEPAKPTPRTRAANATPGATPGGR